MNKKRKEEIINATLDLASKYGLKAISMNMIAQSVGIKKPSLYNHFKSKDELVLEMYNYIRKEASLNVPLTIDFNKYQSSEELLSDLVNNYIIMNNNEKIRSFYKVIYSERCLNKQAANILVEETNKMINATTFVFRKMEELNMLHFTNIEMSAMTFALTIHGIMDYNEDLNFIEKEKTNINEYIKYFCNINERKL